MGKWTDTLTIDMIPEQYRPLAELIGIQQMLAMSEQFGGANLYVPKPEALVRSARDNLIKKQYNGYNAEELARTYDLTVRWVQEICKDAPPPGQLSLEDVCPESFVGVG